MFLRILADPQNVNAVIGPQFQRFQRLADPLGRGCDLNDAVIIVDVDQIDNVA